MVMHLNEIGDDGGELCIYHPDDTKQITPTNGKSVFLK
jgi:hypothetical protein